MGDIPSEDSGPQHTSKNFRCLIDLGKPGLPLQSKGQILRFAFSTMKKEEQGLIVFFGLWRQHIPYLKILRIFASTPSFQLLVGVQGRKSCQIFIRIRARKGYAAGPGCSSSNPAFRTIYPSRSCGDRGFSDEKRCHVQFMASTNRRLITRIHRVLGHDTCNGELHTF